MLKATLSKQSNVGVHQVVSFLDKRAAGLDKTVYVEVAGDLETITTNLQKIREDLESKGYSNQDGFTLRGEFGIYSDKK